MDAVMKQAESMAEEFIENEKDYQMGYVEAELSNDKTRDLDIVFRESTEKGVKTLISVDEDLLPLYKKTLASAEFDSFCRKIYSTLSAGGRVILSGCGSSGRLCMRAEASFREGAEKLGHNELCDKVVSLMTGGDYGLVRAVEFFEDYDVLGEKQVDELELTPDDLFVGVTATAETTSVLGTAIRASENGVGVFMLVCSDPKNIIGKMKRADRLYLRDNVSVIYMPCGAMAVTGSTRMQSASIEQAVLLSALEIALMKIAGKQMPKEKLESGFERMMEYISSDEVISMISDYSDMEAQIYKKGGYVTYFSENYVLDILTDTTERAPTFATPPLRQQCRKNEALSWAFVKNPELDTIDAWYACLGRKPRCIDWNEQVYKERGINESIPDISFNRLAEFEIGRERDTEREERDCTAVWIDTKNAGSGFDECAKYYKNRTELIFCDEDDTYLKIFLHLRMKIILNAISTSAMVLLGRIYGNYMICVDMSNKKLIDRGARIVSDLCGVTYKDALRELFYSYIKIRANGSYDSPAKVTIDRLGR